jgi:heptosyltransferase II
MDFQKKVLIVGPSWIGDIVIAQSLFKYIKHQSPKTIIDIIAPPWSRDLLSAMPEISEIIEMPFGHSQLELPRRWQFGKQLRNRNYQQAIVLPNSWKSGIIPLAARIPLRTGWLGEMRFGVLNNWKILNKKKIPLMIQRFLALGTSPFVNQAMSWENYRPSLVLNSQLIKNTLEELSFKLPIKPFIILCPGAAFGPAKRWPAAYFAEIANYKYSQGWQIGLLGSKNDQSIAQSIQKLTKNNCIDLTGKTSLAQALVILSMATLVLSNDSGLMHCAAALQRPVVVLYGSSSPEFTPPLIQQKRILTLELSCSPCFKRKCPLVHFNCLKQLKPKKVILAINDLLDKVSL